MADAGYLSMRVIYCTTILNFCTCVGNTVHSAGNWPENTVLYVERCEAVLEH